MNEYITVAEFAAIVGRKKNHIYMLIVHGNAVRKLKAKKLHNKWMVRASEINEYPFNREEALQQRLEKRVDELDFLLAEVIRTVGVHTDSITGLKVICNLLQKRGE